MWYRTRANVFAIALSVAISATLLSSLVADVQVLPKHTLEAVLVCLCGQSLAEGVEAGAWNEAPGYGGGGGNTTDQGSRSCVWTELTMPVITAALNLKPTLSDSAIGVLVRRMETASEQPKLQVRVFFFNTYIILL